MHRESQLQQGSSFGISAASAVLGGHAAPRFLRNFTRNVPGSSDRLEGRVLPEGLVGEALRRHVPLVLVRARPCEVDVEGRQHLLFVQTEQRVRMERGWMMRRELQRTSAGTAHIDWLQSASACGCTSVSVPASYVQPAGHVRSAPGATAEQSGVALVSVAVPVHDGPGHCMPANLPSA